MRNVVGIEVTNGGTVAAVGIRREDDSGEFVLFFNRGSSALFPDDARFASELRELLRDALSERNLTVFLKYPRQDGKSLYSERGFETLGALRVMLGLRNAERMAVTVPPFGVEWVYDTKLRKGLTGAGNCRKRDMLQSVMERCLSLLGKIPPMMDSRVEAFALAFYGMDAKAR